MKILLLTESLGSGGAERQLTMLAVSFSRAGHVVHFVTYYPADFYEPILAQHGIRHTLILQKSRARRLLSIRKLLRTSGQDVVLAFLESPSLYAALSRLPTARWGLVVSDRIAVSGLTNPRRSIRRYLFNLYGCASFITTNSHTNRLVLEMLFPHLTNRISTIYNCIDLEAFHPQKDGSSGTQETFRFVVAASYHARKNLSGLIQALSHLKYHGGENSFELDWFGDIPSDHEPFDAAKRQILNLELQDRVRLHPATRDIIGEYHAADAVILPSFAEGLPNAVCEAMACGKPILMSNVCDAGNLVEDGVNGFLFDPSDVLSIANAIQRFMHLPFLQRREMGKKSRERAIELFDSTVITERYLEILRAAAQGQPRACDHWPSKVPHSSYEFVRNHPMAELKGYELLSETRDG